ncbi:glycosyl transferase [Agrobacterium sp. a22-2]|uniref:O-linked N-acetylglucosamine transferase, SPINDLY family protein n=1 Tax=Agrobacterium sp. a22-2 TaxID=2283840 RepID=UPI00144683BD|nr:glycosyl transferase [Agrobacterium sp. a22-2]NKN39466.1 glycosyl transferase [Agrobacterium sp. a22-2]
MKGSLEKAVRDYQAGRYDAALSLAKSAIIPGNPASVGPLALIGNIHLKTGDQLAAAEAFAKAGAFAGDKAASFMKLAVRLYLSLGLTEAVLKIGPRAAQLNPADADLAFTVANLLFSNGRRGELEPLLANLDRGNPQHMALMINHFRLSGRFDELYAFLSQALAATPGDPFLLSTRFTVAREVCDFETMQAYETLMAEPDRPEAEQLLLREAPLARILWSEDEEINSRPSQETRKFTAGRLGQPAPRRPFSAPGTKIRVAYLSNDFFGHATMTLFREAMASHDPDKFDIVLLCHTERHAATQQASWPEALRRCIVPVAHLSDAQVVETIRDLGIDILVDLKGHTMGARLEIVHLSDAPVKATYLGFPGSVTGVDLDYVIADPVVTPDSSQPFYSEKLCRLPETYQANTALARPLPQATTRADHDLPEDALVFASFNATYKITPRTLKLWADVLNAVPDSVFWILCRAEIARRNLGAALADKGVAPSRIVFAGNLPYAEHVSRLPLADLGLDTFPYNGHTTTSDMLWAGLPVLTKKGTAFASRVSESLLKAAGVPELVAQDDADFVGRAVQLAKDPFALAALRQRLDRNRFLAPLFDSDRFTRHLERGYEMMAERARAGQAPDHLDVPALPSRLTPLASR